MLGKLLKKEFLLCLHPTAPLMILLSALILTPNYPYTVSYFYLTLGIFFICLSGRENHDVTFSLTLPIGKKDIVLARVLTTVLLELIQLVAVGLFILLRNTLTADANAAGMDANLALIAEGFFLFGVFQLVFFPSYYKDVSKVGTSFIKSSVALFLLVIVEIVFTYSVPLYRDMLDMPDPRHMTEKLLFLLFCMLFYVFATWLSVRISQKRFSRQDIR